MVGEEVQSTPALLNVVLRIWPQGMHEVRELHAVADEKYLLHINITHHSIKA